MYLKNKIFWVLALVVLLPTLIVVATVNKDKAIKRNGQVMVRLDNYNHVEPDEITCMALMPECGYCPGEIIDKQCYVEKSQASKYR